MIIRNLDIIGIAFMPFKANAPLPVDADSVLAFSITFKGVELVTRIQHERFKTYSRVKNHQSFSCLTLKGLKATHPPVLKKLLCIFTGKGFDHKGEAITLSVICQAACLVGIKKDSGTPDLRDKDCILTPVTPGRD